MAEGWAADAYAKLNLGLVVGDRAADGYHPLTSLAQSISWADRVELAPAEADAFSAEGMESTEDNLAWRALVAVRSEATRRRAVKLHLDKRIAVAAGLGGGSADAAAVLALAAELLGVPAERLPDLALALGADVPFCLSGGLAILEGRGEQITELPAATGYAVAVVVPPFELATPAVYRRWDELDGPEGVPFPTAALPPSLRSFEPLRNDLQPAADALAPELADWREDLARRWGRPVALTGSGPALFGYFLDEEEAAAAVAGSTGRAARAATPVSRGWSRVPGTLTDPEWGVV
ncbi:MAG: 4-(cytidine 5'-diphospho)-2-C-methyl-D-erythritol kinase [Acidimicrobiia bacterium]|nr:4-(cytidine 5'-diphospho)-2-C-methyl-D-erythritol kinase [Acidimicrobiia bacterium]NNF09945.1 4-(cytidine 5'-diphospho)-2-C-methyl-D-erythritol kinase [Acidimicrobiia bacterium]NNL68726.1 4-(cytidine 5'-diphospho)-2-C-methyl-D-erythritol kinase [Acidimicrobiia bacterium]